MSVDAALAEGPMAMEAVGAALAIGLVSMDAMAMDTVPMAEKVPLSMGAALVMGPKAMDAMAIAEKVPDDPCFSCCL